MRFARGSPERRASCRARRVRFARGSPGRRAACRVRRSLLADQACEKDVPLRPLSWEIMGGHGKSWEVMGGHGRSWEIMGGHGRSWEVMVIVIVSVVAIVIVIIVIIVIPGSLGAPAFSICHAFAGPLGQG